MCQQCENLNHLFENNRRWIEQKHKEDPTFFQRLSVQHDPDYLWIGCSDARVPANQILGLMPGEVFVHRNIANLVNSADLNALSVIEYAVEVLKVRHIMVTGHYGCGGVKAALDGEGPDMVAHWIRPVRKYALRHQAELAQLDEQRRWDRLCEINVIEQVRNLCHIPAIRKAWERGQTLHLHGLIYSVRDGVVRDMEVTVCNAEQADRLLTRQEK